MTRPASRPVAVMASPDDYEVCYTINPWMRPEAWAEGGERVRALARAQWQSLADRLGDEGYCVEVVPSAPGLPDLVFTANSAIVLDGKAIVARFRYSQRRGEEACFVRFFEGLKDRGLLAHVEQFPEGVFQEGAGDCLWDPTRRLFWAAYGPRSARESHAHIERLFGYPVVPLELVTDRFYHLDTCFCVLSGGEVMYFPGALSPASQGEVLARVPDALRIAASEAEAATFSLNAVNIGRHVVMTEPPPRLKAELEGRGYQCRIVDLSCFLLSGGASYCMTLRLDLVAEGVVRSAAE